MPDNRDSVQKLIQTLETIQGRELEPEDLGDIQEWNKGRALAQIVATPGWTVILEILASYPADAMRKLSSIDPKEKDEVAAQHAVFYCSSRIYNNFVEDVANAVEKARSTPRVVKQGLKAVSPAPPDLSF